MSSPRTEPTDHPDDAVEQPTRTRLSAVQIAAGALASVSAAVVASFFGVAGTLIGAAVASVISTISAALYSNSLNRTNDQLRRVRSQLVTAVPRSRTDAQPAAPPATRVMPAALDPRRPPAPRRAPRWRMAGYAVAVFGLAMAIVTGIEVVGQQPVSALVGAQEASSATTLGELTGNSSAAPTTPGAPPTTPAPSGTSATPASDAPAGSTDDDVTEDGTSTTAPSTTAGSTAAGRSSTTSSRTSSQAPSASSGAGESSAGAAAGTTAAPATP